MASRRRSSGRRPWRSGPGGLVVWMAAALGLLAAPALMAQDAGPAPDSPAELRRENDLLRQRIAELEAQLAAQRSAFEAQAEALSAELASCEAESAELRARLGAVGGDEGGKTRDESAGGASDPSAEPELAEPATDPFAHPRALHAALESSYAEAFAGRDLLAEPRARAVGDVRRWARDAEREFRKRVEWLIEVEDVTPSSPVEAPIRFRVLDPGSGLPFSEEPSRLELPERLAATVIGNSGVRVWLVRGWLEAEPEVNAERSVAGLPDFPPFLGPFAEFSWGFSRRGLEVIPVEP